MGANSSKDSINKEDLDFLTKNTSYGEATIKDFYRGFIHSCPDGRLNQATFLKIYKESFLCGNPSEFREHLFRAFDNNSNGFIEFRELLTAIYITSLGSPHEKLNLSFR